MRKPYFIVLMLFTLLSACKKDDLCENIVCLNGGSCVNGSCNCPTGYTGADCSQQMTPSRINITSITLLDFPTTTSSGGSWDFSNGADVYLVLELNGVEVADNRSNAYTNELPPLHWSNLPTAFEMDEPTNQYTLRVYDRDDFPPDQYLGGINFTPYNSNNGFPTKLTLSCPGCIVAELKLDYDF